MKKPFYLLLFLFFTVCIPVNAQQKDSIIKNSGSSVLKPTIKPGIKKDTIKKTLKDSLKEQRIKDSVMASDSPLINKNTVSKSDYTPSLVYAAELEVTANDTSQLLPVVSQRFPQNIVGDVLLKNRFIDISGKAVSQISEYRNKKGKEFLFYSICTLVLFLGLFKTFFSSYFNNLFRVFFNTSLHQAQLTDQLLQAKLPSFILNIFFTLAAGMYIWLLFIHFDPPQIANKKLLLPFCIIALASIYIIKFCILKFTGWMAEVSQITDSYIFIIFFVNKIYGVMLVPFIVLLAFSNATWVDSIATITILLLGLFFVSRYLKSYGIIGNKISLNPFHFIIFILSVEILPMLILYKIVTDYLI